MTFNKAKVNSLHIMLNANSNMLMCSSVDHVSVNVNDCIMTRIQEMSLNYHFKVEQESGSSLVAFFGFNGRLWLL